MQRADGSEVSSDEGDRDGDMDLVVRREQEDWKEEYREGPTSEA